MASKHEKVLKSITQKGMEIKTTVQYPPEGLT